MRKLIHVCGLILALPVWALQPGLKPTCGPETEARASVAVVAPAVPSVSAPDAPEVFGPQVTIVLDAAARAELLEALLDAVESKSANGVNVAAVTVRTDAALKAFVALSLAIGPPVNEAP